MAAKTKDQKATSRKPRKPSNNPVSTKPLTIAKAEQKPEGPKIVGFLVFTPTSGRPLALVSVMPGFEPDVAKADATAIAKRGGGKLHSVSIDNGELVTRAVAD